MYRDLLQRTVTTEARCASFSKFRWPGRVNSISRKGTTHRSRPQEGSESRTNYKGDSHEQHLTKDNRYLLVCAGAFFSFDRNRLSILEN